jgi:ADP-heptose:LPS heptosyltransferase
MKCNVDENFWCERHQVHHRGKLFELSQDETALGDKYRAMWDAQMVKTNALSEKKKTWDTIGTLASYGDATAGEICPVNTAYFCTRHKTYHVGTALDLALDPGPKGQRARAEWDAKRELIDRRNVDPAKRRIRLTYYQCPGDTLASVPALLSLKQAFPGLELDCIGGKSEDLFQHSPLFTSFKTPDLTIKMENPLVNISGQAPISFAQSYHRLLEDRLGLAFPLLHNKPEVWLSDEEKAWQSPWGEYWLLCRPGAKKDYTVKRYGNQQLQEVVDRLRGKVQFVQIGEKHHEHKPLEGVVDMIGKTSVRECVRLAYHAKGILCGESFPYHLGIAVNRPTVCLASAWLSKQWITYPTGTVLGKWGHLECCAGGTCGAKRIIALKDGSDKDKSLCKSVDTTFNEPLPKCMTMISVDEVVRAVEDYGANYTMA